MTKYHHLAVHEIHRALAANHEAIAALHRHHDFLLTGLGIPRDEISRMPITISNGDLIEELQAVNQELESELSRR
jgi:hypothetical protein